ncbi:MAG: 2-oxoacid:acceptor oxidoreductase family protein, partial [Candidatus Eremiobacteraeota bacterium]|nr:2-oxoacid:acceptor oxidoreductase family protein [Candidatus Eremiobacteraeota bacterium]
MIEIRLHGRGGQGVVTAAELIATAAWEDKIHCLAFPTFGSERMGAPVASFVRLSKEGPIRIRSEIYEPDHLIIQDPTLIGTVDVFGGLKPGGLVIINTQKKPEELHGIPEGMKVITFPATDLALEILGRPIPNTILLGVYAAATGLIQLPAIIRAIEERFPP